MSKMKSFIMGSEDAQQYAIAIDLKGQSIGIRRIASYRGVPVPKESQKTVVFKVGDEAISGSYNLIYLDRIASITEKTVTLAKSYKGGKSIRMKLARFVSYNADFDLEYIKKSNAETMQYI
jgi:hypothetical protein